MNKNNFNKAASTFTWLIALLILSVVLLIAIIAISSVGNYNVLSIEKEVSIIDIINCVISICSLAAGLFVIEIFNKRSERDKSEKDLIINLIKKLMDDTDIIYRTLQSEPVLADLNLSIKDLFTDYKFLKEVERNIANNNIVDLLEDDFVKMFRRFKSKCTRTSAKNESQDITLNGENIVFSTNALQEANIAKNNLKLVLLKSMNEYL
ncbi:hypothetical protein [Hymenobacter volaticus]|uniref:Uncharacterized protein n=1 Tax=Hymenobacter volaticus TaxID=2932254 RepID=A0ABY4G5F9_9BACT|nr:hypothetical protein [Hymenobacter volaticus]UOQ65854.1 hypothetical protein MUN86_20390 [Hymenobacter volaticus]